MYSFSYKIKIVTNVIKIKLKYFKNNQRRVYRGEKFKYFFQKNSKTFAEPDFKFSSLIK